MLKKLIKHLLKLFSYTIKKVHKLNVITFNKEDAKNFENYYIICVITRWEHVHHYIQSLEKRRL